MPLPVDNKTVASVLHNNSMPCLIIPNLITQKNPIRIIKGSFCKRGGTTSVMPPRYSFARSTKINIINRCLIVGLVNIKHVLALKVIIFYIHPPVGIKNPFRPDWMSRLHVHNTDGRWVASQIWPRRHIIRMQHFYLELFGSDGSMKNAISIQIPRHPAQIRQQQQDENKRP